MRIILLCLLLCGCKPGFSSNDTLAYVQDRPVAPYVTYVGYTGSMEPELKGGDPIVVTKIDIKDVKVGDNIITYWEAERIPVIHKVFAKFVAANGQIGLVTKGNANPSRDYRITTEKELVGLATSLR